MIIEFEQQLINHRISYTKKTTPTGSKVFNLNLKNNKHVSIRCYDENSVCVVISPEDKSIDVSTYGTRVVFERLSTLDHKGIFYVTLYREKAHITDVCIKEDLINFC